MSDTTILITGASTGLGYLMAQQLADDGHLVLATMRNIAGKNADAATALSAYSNNIKPIDLDVADQASVDAAMAAIADISTSIDVLINNAGVVNSGLIEAFSIDELKAEMEVNYFGIARMFKAVLPLMRAKKAGLIITISSLTGRLVFPGFPTYSASKFAVEALAEGYRYDLSGLGIDSVIIEPGPVKTELLNNAANSADSTIEDAYGDIAQMPALVEAAFSQFMVDNADGASNPQLVVDDVKALIALPFGKRPLRTVSGADYGVRNYNDAVASIQSDLLKGMQIAHLDPNHTDTDD
jgi:NADP-dependent 3-hydroxy acid dehydrogenase YdfG